MQISLICILLGMLAFVAVSGTDVYTNHFYLVMKKGADDHSGEAAIQRVARDTGLRVVRRHLGQDTEYHVVHDEVAPEHTDPNTHPTGAIAQHPDVKQVVQQVGFRREKRGFKSMPRPAAVKSATADDKSNKSMSEPTDPLYSQQWYIKNTGQAEGTPGLDLNVLSAWRAGYTGRNVTVAILDDGLDYLHPDVAKNYNSEASFDFSSNDPYPYPRFTDDWFNSHGTRCAGEVAAIRDNGICGVGVAPNSRIASLRVLDQPFMTDLLEAAAIAFQRDIIDIYSASWGPRDDGKTVDGPREQTMRAIVDGIQFGRRGRGNIFVWASGDGGQDDDCNCDGYTASMWTISINSVTNSGQRAIYDESCSSTLASTFSNGNAYGSDIGVATIDLYGKCTLKHSGTSAAAPEAAGVFALALEANQELTWRDMQHLVVLTSRQSNLTDLSGEHKWTPNAAGLLFNHLFGFGVLDAGAMVQMARIWRPLPQRFSCTVGRVTRPAHFDILRTAELALDLKGCENGTVRFIEHVQAFVTLRASRRGDVVLLLTSPSNTTSVLLGKRASDNDSLTGFNAWPFMTTHMWGESPSGRWTLRALVKATEPISHGVITDWTLTIHGTQTAPYEGLAGDALSGTVARVRRIQGMRKA